MGRCLRWLEFGFAELANGVTLFRWRGFIIRAICSVIIRALKVGLCPIPHSFISFACPKEMNQRKGQPQIFFGIAILLAAHAIQLALRLPADHSNSIAYY
jgi:hypothetical protein